MNPAVGHETRTQAQRRGRGLSRSHRAALAAMVAFAVAAVIPPSPVPASAGVLTPSVSAVSPNSGTTSGGTTVTITGTHFVVGATTVKFGSTSATSVQVVDTQHLTATSPPECSGIVDIAVTTTVGGTSPTSSSDQYTYQAATPSVTSISPATGSTSGPTTVNVTGTNLLCPSYVQVGSTSAQVVSDANNPNTPTHLELLMPAQPSGTSGDTVVSSSGGQSSTSAGDVFSWLGGAPNLTALSPSSGPSAGGTTVSLSGTGLLFATGVTFGGVSSPSFSVNSDSQLTLISPPGCGTVSVVVTTAAGPSQPLQFAYSALAPSVASVSPSAGPLVGGNSVVIQGSNLLCATAVTFGATSATSFHVDSDSQITALAPSGAAGVVDVVVTTALGTSPASGSDHYAYQASPTVASVTPGGGPLAGGNSVTIAGENFATDAQVTFGGVAATNVVVSSFTSLTATVPASTVSGPVDVVVTTSGGTSAPQFNGQYVYGVPTVTSVTPAIGPVGGGADVRITGTDFASGSTVTFGGQAVSAAVLSPTLIDVPSSPSGTTGTTVDVVVADAAGSSPTSSADQYQFAIRPKITSMTPQSGNAGGGTSVTITGTGLINSPTVYFGGVKATAVVINGNGTLTATSPAGAAGSTVDVTVETYGGVSGASAADLFSYLSPQVTSLFPAAGPTAGGTTVTITGSGFGGPTTVTFGTLASPSVTVTSSTQILATSPAVPSPQTVSVTVTSNGTTVTAGSFSYDPAPTLTGVSPNGGPAAGGTAVTVTGTGFLHNVQVCFAALCVAPSTIAQDGQSLTVATPAIGIVPSNGVVDIVVQTAGGRTVTSQADQFAYGPPTVSSVSPLGGPLNTAEQVTLTGTGYVLGAQVFFGTTQGSGVVVSSPTSLTVITPLMSSAVQVSITVTTSAGTSLVSSAGSFTFGPASVTSINPTLGSSHGGQVLTLAVTRFVNDSAVRINVGSTAVTSYTYDPLHGTVSITTPPNSTTTSATVQVSVTDDGGTSNSQSYTYWAPPTITSVTPNAGPTTGNRWVTITGSNFLVGKTSVSFGSVSAQNSALGATLTSITILTPAESAGTVDIRVQDVVTNDISALTSADHYVFEGQGYWSTQSSGGVFQHGAAGWYGSASNLKKPISGMAETPDGRGYWLTTQDGGVYPFGDASSYGSMASTALNAPVSGIAATPDGKGYWLVAQDGGVFAFGDAHFFGSLAGTTGPAVNGIAALEDPTQGQGYWLVDGGGGVYPYGSARQLGNMAGHALNAPMVGIAATYDGGGYWLIGADGGVFNFPTSGGDAFFYGSEGNSGLTGWFALAPTPSGNGYWLMNTNGAVQPDGDATFLGGTGGATAAASLFGA